VARCHNDTDLLLFLVNVETEVFQYLINIEFSCRFAAALINLPVWVMNVVPIHEPDTLTFIFDRGLIGVYHDWCESFNTYPRTYDLLHSVFLFSNLPERYM